MKKFPIAFVIVLVVIVIVIFNSLVIVVITLTLTLIFFYVISCKLFAIHQGSTLNFIVILLPSKSTYQPFLIKTQLIMVNVIDCFNCNFDKSLTSFLLRFFLQL